MFNREYQFIGKYSKIVKKLVSPVDTTSGLQIFDRNVDVLCIASLVGFLWNKTSENDNSEGARNQTTKIFLDTLMNEKKVLDFNYRMIMILHDREKINMEERLNRAFRYSEKNPKREECDRIFESYIFGGLEILESKILESAIYTDDYINNLYKFMNEYNKRYEEVSSESIEELCRKAGN